MPRLVDQQTPSGSPPGATAPGVAAGGSWIPPVSAGVSVAVHCVAGASSSSPPGASPGGIPSAGHE
eukprot:12111572-Alexandrium_andersonii.AAC.1